MNYCSDCRHVRYELLAKDPKQRKFCFIMWHREEDKSCIMWGEK